MRSELTTSRLQGGRCHDNACCESMWARMKTELLYDSYDPEQLTVEQLKSLECVSSGTIRKFEWILRQFKEETRRLSSAKSRVDDAEMAQRRPKLRIREFLRHTLRLRQHPLPMTDRPHPKRRRQKQCRSKAGCPYAAQNRRTLRVCRPPPSRAAFPSRAPVRRR